jgi:AraC family transcriptional regulator
MPESVPYSPTVTEQSPISKQARHKEVGRTRLVRLTEYHCPFGKDAPVAAEQFSDATISIVRSGAFRFRSDRDDQLLATGFLLLANPGQCYEISHEQSGGDQCVIFRFDEAVLEEISGSETRSRVRRYFSRSVLPPIPRVDALRQLLDQRFPEEGLDEVGLALAVCVFEHSAARPSRTARPLQPSRRSRDTIFAALEHIERTSAQEHSLSEVACFVGLSPYHFLRLFKRETGVTPHRHLTQTRLRKAIELLRDTSQPVTEIASTVGFGDLSNFINYFGREIGCSPSQFRKAEAHSWATAFNGAVSKSGVRAAMRKIYQVGARPLP